MTTWYVCQIIASPGSWADVTVHSVFAANVVDTDASLNIPESLVPVKVTSAMHSSHTPVLCSPTGSSQMANSPIRSVIPRQDVFRRRVTSCGHSTSKSRPLYAVQPTYISQPAALGTHLHPSPQARNEEDHREHRHTILCPSPSRHHPHSAT